MTEFDKQIERIKKASPLELPYIIMETELHDKKSAYELYEDVSKTFEGEGIIDNVVAPVITTMIDGVLAMRCFRGVSRKMGLSSQRVMQECKSFSYEGKVSFLMPDSFVESKNNAEVQQLWGNENRNEYIREQYENKYLMDKYKKGKSIENGSRVNMEDEYRKTHDITSSKAKADRRRNDPKNEHNAETDHIIPLHTVFSQLQNNSALSSGDIRRVANQDINFAVTGRMINNPKRDMTNSEFIKEQDRRKNLGLPYVELNETQRANMIQMERDAQKSIEKCVNETVLNNLSGKGQVDRKERKDAIKKKEQELGRKLTAEERAAVDKKLGEEKASNIHMGNLKNAGKSSLMYLGGNVILLVVKPLYYEIKDSIMNGFLTGVCANSIKEAITIRFSRVKNYVWSYLISIKDRLGTALDFIKDFISALIEGIIGMFVGVFKQVLRVLKEGVKIGMQAFSVLFGKESKEMTAGEKGDAIIKILGSSVVALCGIGINTLLEKVPILDDDGRNVVSTILTGLASILLFYVLDKADLFNVKKDKREQRLNEVFEMRIKDINENTNILEKTVADSIRRSYILSQDMLKEIRNLSKTDNYKGLNRILQQYHDMMFPNNNTTQPNWNC
jgi:hypothetical protein